MKKFICFLVTCCLICLSAGCTSMFRPKTAPDLGIGTLPYTGLKARLAVGDFEISTMKATNEIGLALREMLINILTSTGRFIIFNRIPGQAQQEAPAELIVSINLVDFEPQASGGRSGIGGGGGVSSGALGGLLGTPLNNARVALDVRIADAVSLRPVSSIMHIKGQASDSNIGNIYGNWALAKELSVYSRTPMEKAIRISVIETARYVIDGVPERFYKY